jgi:hypothetical protein
MRDLGKKSAIFVTQMASFILTRREKSGGMLPASTPVTPS